MNAFSTTWTYIRRSPYQSFAAILAMFLTFLLGGIFVLTTLASFVTLQFFESKPQLTVFLAEKAGKPEADTLTQLLEQTGKVASVKFVSKDEALAIYKEQNKNDPLLLEMVTADILPASLEISAKAPQYLSELEPIIKQADGVEEVIFQRDVVDTLLAWTNAIRIIGGILASLLALTSLLIIMTVVGMKIAIRREEIDIMKLIGASKWYIRYPFLLEGGLYGLIGAGCAWVVIEGILLAIRPNLLSFFGTIPILQMVFADPFSSLFIMLSLGLLFVMISVAFILGSIGSLLTVGRYVKF